MRRFDEKTNKKRSGRSWLPAVGLLLALTGAMAWGLSMDTAPDTPSQSTQVETSQLIFSELCTKNDSIIADNEGRYRDYVEIYNSGKAIDLKGYCLTDGRGKSAPFPSLVIPQNGYCLLFVDQELTGFSLGASGGDYIQLLNPDGEIAAQASTMLLSADQVMLYSAQGYTVSQQASPGFPNDEAGILAFQTGSVDENPILRISELLTENNSSLPDERGQFRDVAELHNNGTGPVFLEDYYLSDSMESRFRFRLPAVTLNPGEYIVIYCDGGNMFTESGEIHTNFGLSAGETLCLTGKDGSYHTLAVQFPGEDLSTAFIDGTYQPAPVSLGYANNEFGIASFQQSRNDENAPLVISEILLSSAQVPYHGTFSDVVEIRNLSGKAVSTAGWYLSDGGDPYTYPLPQKNLEPGESLIVQCSRELTDFALSQKDVLRLFSPTYKWASLVSCGLSTPGMSISRIDSESYAAGAVSLGYANTPDGVESYAKDRLPEQLRISEIMTANRSYLKGPYGDTSDWVELYNASDEAISLADYCLSDDAEEPRKYPLPDRSLDPGEYCVILLSDKDRSFREGHIVVPLSLSSNGDTLYLGRNGEITDFVLLPQMPTDYSYGRAADCAAFSLLADVTAGEENGQAASMSAMPQAVTAQGVYENVEFLDVQLSGSGTIYYTTDASTPTDADTPYTGPIHLTETTVIRAICVEDGKLPSQVLDLTYFLNEGDELPAVSLVTDPKNLWDHYSGIYVEGPNPGTEFPYTGANYWQPWEKPATVSLFEKDGGGFSTQCGLSIFGAYSRALGMKAFTCFFRDAYGDGTLDYPLFGEEGLDQYESFILRCSGQDVYKSRMRDVLTTSLVADYTNVAVQKYRPVVLYLNGEFWGVYYIREKINENYVAGNQNVAVEDVTLCVGNGLSSDEYKNLVLYAQTHDLSEQEHFDYICSQMDVVEYMDYIIAEMYVANTDNGNIKFFKTPEGKWTWVLYDTDYGFQDVSFNAVGDHLHPGGTGFDNAFTTALMNALLKNPEFEEAFIRRIAWQLDTIWNEETVNARIDELEAQLYAGMVKEFDVRNRYTFNWPDYVNELREFVAVRNELMPQHVRYYFGLTNDELREYGFDV